MTQIQMIAPTETICVISQTEPQDSIFELAKFIAKKMLIPKQHVTLVMVGEGGIGKSYAMFNLCEEIAKHLGSRLKRPPTDFFNIDHVAIINTGEIRRVMKKTKKHGIYVLDDIGVGLNARKHGTEINMLMNDIFQTFRPDSNFLGATCYDPMLVDTVIRSFAKYYVEMIEAHHSAGFTVGKFFKAVRKHRQRETYYEYLTINGKRYTRSLFYMPSKEFCYEYDKRRDAQLELLKEKNLKRWESLEAKENKDAEKEMNPKKSMKEQAFEIYRDVKAGVYDSVKEACDIRGVKYSGILQNKPSGY